MCFKLHVMLQISLTSGPAGPCDPVICVPCKNFTEMNLFDAIRYILSGTSNISLLYIVIVLLFHHMTSTGGTLMHKLINYFFYILENRVWFIQQVKHLKMQQK